MFQTLHKFSVQCTPMLEKVLNSTIYYKYYRSTPATNALCMDEARLIAYKHIYCIGAHVRYDQW